MHFLLAEVYNVTLAVYSSAPDPVWTVALPKGQIIDANTNDPNDLPQRLGYKWFIVQSGKKARLIVGPKTTSQQLQLLDTIPQNVLSAAYVKHIRSEINSGAVKASTSSQRITRNAPPYEPNQWRGIRRICNNCITMRITKYLITLLNRVIIVRRYSPESDVSNTICPPNSRSSRKRWLNTSGA